MLNPNWTRGPAEDPRASPPAGRRSPVVELGLPFRFSEEQVVFTRCPGKDSPVLAQLEAELHLLVRRHTAGLRAEVERLRRVVERYERREQTEREAKARQALLVRE